MVVNRVGVWSAARTAGILYAAMGLIIGAVIALLSLVGSGLASLSDSPGSGWLGIVFGVGAIVFLPIFYGVVGLVAATIAAALYNLVSRVTGGLEIDLR